MKIYNEVTIDMNPESSTYGKHLSEDSHDYQGDVVLLRRAKSVKAASKWGPGVQALGMDKMAGGATGRFPTKLPGTWGGTVAQGIHTGEDVIAGQDIGSMTALDPYMIEKTGQSSSGMGRRRRSDWGATEQFSKDFGEAWYKPYMEAAMIDPMKAIEDKGFREVTAESSGIKQEILDKITGVQGYGGDTEGAGGPTDWAGKVIASKDAIGELMGAREGLGRLEEDKESALADIETAKLTAGETRDKALRDQATKRVAAAGSAATQAESLSGEGGAGWAYSGPTAAFQAEQREAGEEGFRQTGRDVADINRGYEQAMEGFEGDVEEVEGQYEEDVEDYGSEIGTILAGSNEQLNTLLGAVGQLQTQHQDWGDYLGSKIATPRGWSAWSDFGPQKSIAGQTGYGAPEGGWFRDVGRKNITENLITEAQRIAGSSGFGGIGAADWTAAEGLGGDDV